MAIRIYTDGGCLGNPGPGGWAYMIIQKTDKGEEVITEKSGGEKNTTNNRMEMAAVIAALKAFKNKKTLGTKATLYTDSQYVQKGISEWIHKWKENNWRTSDKKPVKNQDLWEALDALAEELSISWKWVKGHAGNVYNERCDELTQRAIAKL